MPSRGTHLASTKRPVRAPAVPRTRSRGRSLPSSAASHSGSGRMTKSELLAIRTRRVSRRTTWPAQQSPHTRTAAGQERGPDAGRPRDTGKGRSPSAGKAAPRARSSSCQAATPASNMRCMIGIPSSASPSTSAVAVATKGRQSRSAIADRSVTPNVFRSPCGPDATRLSGWAAPRCRGTATTARPRSPTSGRAPRQWRR